jgi:hypothetical protein
MTAEPVRTTHDAVRDPMPHDPTPEQKLRTMIDDFKAELTRHGAGNPNAANNFESMFERSPYLKTLALQAVRDGHLHGFEINGNGFSGGNYDPNDRILRLNYGELAIGHEDPKWMGQNIHLAAHEVRHALERNAGQRQFLEFEAAASKEMQRMIMPGSGQAPGSVQQPPHDYTRALAGFIEANRRSEAVAEIAGFNAVVSMIRADGRTPDLASIYEAAPEKTGEYIRRSGEAPNHRYALQPGIVLNADFTLSESLANKRAVGREYFDDPAAQTQLGARKDQDYSNHVAVRALQYIVSVESRLPALYAEYGLRPSPVHINMKALGLDEKQLEPYLNLRDGKPFVYYDTSSGVPVKKSFDPFVEKAPEKQDATPGPNDPGKVAPGKTGKPGKGPDGEGYGADGVGAIDPLERLDGRRRADYDTIAATVARDGRWDDAASRNIAGALLLEVERDPGVRQVDRVLLTDRGADSRVFAMYSPNGDREPYFHASVDAASASRVPAAQTLAEVAARSASQSPTQGQGLQPGIGQDQQEPARGALRMA